MVSTVVSNGETQGKKAFYLAVVLSFALVILYWVMRSVFSLNETLLVLTQIALYGLLFLLAVWGLKKEKIALPVNARLLFGAVGWLIIIWLWYALFIYISGLANIDNDLQLLASTPVWRIFRKILLTWIFVGMGEELLFRGYFLPSIQKKFNNGTSLRRMAIAIVISSLLFSIWHLPDRIVQIISGQMPVVMLIPSLLIVFLIGLGYAFLFMRTNNIFLVGLLHGIADFPLIGLNLLSSIPVSIPLLIIAISGIEIYRRIKSRKPAGDR
ncbi:MAG: CPBP family intramembrane metalloprotease [Anaerolineales bacterium]|nr:CPBP family intramembrane metalloprotease [Anaerolineales bacterium]